MSERKIVVPEEVKDLLCAIVGGAYDVPQDGFADRHNRSIIEAFRRGQKAPRQC